MPSEEQKRRSFDAYRKKLEEVEKYGEGTLTGRPVESDLPDEPIAPKLVPTPTPTSTIHPDIRKIPGILNKKEEPKQPESETPAPKTDLGKQVADYWKPKSLRPNREKGYVEYVDLETGKKKYVGALDPKTGHMIPKAGDNELLKQFMRKFNPKESREFVRNAPSMETSGGEAPADYWKPKSVKLDRKQNTISYKDASDGLDVTVYMNEGEMPPPKGNEYLKQFLRNLRPYIESALGGEAQSQGESPVGAATADTNKPPATTASSSPEDKNKPSATTASSSPEDKNKTLSTVAPITQLPATTTPEPRKADVSLGNTDRGLIPYTSRSGDASSGSSVEREGREYSPADEAAIRQAAKEAEERKNTLYEKMLGMLNTPATDVNRKKITEEYMNAVGKEKKAQMWDSIVTALGKIAAGGIGLGGLGIGGKQLIEPGLDVSKYYTTGEPYDVKPGMDAAKNVMEAKLGEVQADLDSRKADMQTLQQLQAAGNEPVLLKYLESLANKYRTQQTQNEGVKSGAGVTEDPALAAKKKAAGGSKEPPKLQEWTSPTESTKNKARLDSVRDIEVKDKDSLRNRFLPAYNTTTDAAITYAEAEAKKANPKLKLDKTNEAEYWNEINKSLTDISHRYFNPPTAPASVPYSLWYLEVKEPFEKHVGKLVLVPAQSSVYGGFTTDDIYGNPNSAYNQVKTKHPRISKMKEGPEKKKAILAELQKEQF
jgi:hypothetical protein